MQLLFPLNIDYAKNSLVLSTNSERIRFTGVSPELGVRVLQEVNMGNTAADIHARFDSQPDASKFLDCLVSNNLLAKEPPNAYSGRQLAKFLQELYKEWNNSLFSHPLWTSLADGSAPTSLVDGWLIESYHFIRGANARLCYAAAYAQDERLQAIFAKHYVEEYDHYKYFADSLARRDIDAERVDMAGPIASTSAVLNMARRAARIDPLAYAACSGLLESTGSDANRARDFYCAVRKNFDLEGSGFVEPMLRHIDLDEEFEHGSVMVDVFDPIPHITIDRADAVVATVSLFEETLRLWFTDIREVYSVCRPHDRLALLRNHVTKRR